MPGPCLRHGTPKECHQLYLYSHEGDTDFRGCVAEEWNNDTDDTDDKRSQAKLRHATSSAASSSSTLSCLTAVHTRGARTAVSQTTHASSVAKATSVENIDVLVPSSDETRRTQVRSTTNKDLSEESMRVRSAHVTLSCAALCCTPLRCVTLRYALLHASLGDEPKKLLARLRAARGCERTVHTEHALGVLCCGACGRRLFSRVAKILCEAWTHHTPTLRVDAHPPQGASTCITCTTV